jgi:hypothetical protein
MLTDTLRDHEVELVQQARKATGAERKKLFDRAKAIEKLCDKVIDQTS